MSTLKAPIRADDHIKGPPEAPVTLVEYGDYECAHCGARHDRDINGAVNIRAAGLAVLACGASIRPAREPSRTGSRP